MAHRPSFLAELKRRNVLRAVLLYLGAVWALSQGVSQLTPSLGLPDYTTRWFLLACAIGFPFWVAFAWFYEFTPEGLKRDTGVAADAPGRHGATRKLDLAIIGVLVVAVALLASGYFVGRGESTPALAVASNVPGIPFNPPANTLVVLPFANDNGDPKQQYFSDGITEELTNALGQNTALRVIAWDTASKYRDSKQSASDIARTLDVANVLTGKILRQGDEIRVIVELVNARTGYQAWSHHYDDTQANIFQVQDKITASIANALQVQFAATHAAPAVNPEAHDLVLQARALLGKARSSALFEQARALLERAVQIAPDYADAHAQLASTWYGLTQYSTLPLKDALPKVRAEASKALALDPRNVTAVMVRANADYAEGKLAEARAGYKRALEIDPSNADAHVNYGTVLPLQQAQAQYLEAVQLDPDNAGAQNNLAAAELDLGEYQQALAPVQALLKLDPRSADSALGLAQVYALLHRNDDAVKAFDLAQPDTPLAKALVAAGRLVYQSVLDPKLHAQALAAVEALHQRVDLDPYSTGDVMQLYLVLGDTAPVLDMLTKFCAAQPLGCSDLSINPSWLSLRGQPRFEALVRQYDTVSKPASAATAAPASGVTTH